MFRTAVVAGFVAYASAQAFSQQCIGSIAGIAADPTASACLSPGSLLSIGTQSSTASLVPVINTWLGSLCSQPACSNDTIAAAVKNVTAGCSTELAVFGYTSDMVTTITQYVQQYYPTVRKVACLKDGNNNCVTETLTAIESHTGTLSLSSLQTNATKISQAVVSLPSSVYCTNCVKQGYNVIAQDVPSLTGDLKPLASQQCGAAFVDGSAASGISQSASTASAGTTKKNDAVSILSNTVVMGLGASGLIAISTVFTFLA